MQADVIADGFFELTRLRPAFPAGAEMFLQPLRASRRKLSIRGHKEFFASWMRVSKLHKGLPFGGACETRQRSS